MNIDEQIKCVSRELNMRRKCYPKWVEAGQMQQSAADWELVAMAEVLKTLRKLADKDQLQFNL